MKDKGNNKDRATIRVKVKENQGKVYRGDKKYFKDPPPPYEDAHIQDSIESSREQHRTYFQEESYPKKILLVGS